MFDKLKTLKQEEKQSLTEPARGEEPDLSDIQLLLELRLQKEREKVVKAPFPNLVQNVEKREWTPGSKRVGAIGVKLGMSCLWLKNGSRIGVTLVQVRGLCQNYDMSKVRPLSSLLLPSKEFLLSKMPM